MTDRLFYDGECGLCHATVRFLLARDREGTFRFAPLGGAAFRAALGTEAARVMGASRARQTVVVRTADGRLLVRSAALLYCLRRLGGRYALLATLLGLVPRPLLDAGYRVVARVRHRLFARPAGTCPVTPPALRARFDP